MHFLHTIFQYFFENLYIIKCKVFSIQLVNDIQCTCVSSRDLENAFSFMIIKKVQAKPIFFSYLDVSHGCVMPKARFSCT